MRALLRAMVLLALFLGLAAAAVAADPAVLAPLGGAVFGAQPDAVSWNGRDPLNILVMGVDPRGAEAPHSDTMIVLHVDPAVHDVTMLSVPRDLYITLPGNYGATKINAAITIGYNAVIGPQGAVAATATGAQYAQLAVQRALGIPIDYYAVIRFAGFKRIVDALGGVTVCVPRALNDPTYPADTGYGYHPIDIKAGCQRMDGTVALEYARERHANAQQDLGRIQQQQALLTGIEKTLLSPGMLPRLPALLGAVNGAVATDLPRAALPELGLLLGRAGGAHTRHAYIDTNGGDVTQGTSGDGQSILVGNWPKIHALVTALFADPRLRAEHATVQVRNGQHTPGLATLYTGLIRGMGFATIAPRDADKSTYVRPLLVANADRPGAAYTVRMLQRLLQANVATRHIGSDHAQIVAILGSNVAEGS